MRVVGGSIGGRRYELPQKLPARPTTDRAKEGLFNILHNLIDLDSIAALDLFSGSGGVSYELLSRGAASVTAVETDRHSVVFIQKTAAEFGIVSRLKIVAEDVFKFLRNATGSYNFIFADPPYALPQMAQFPQTILGGDLLLPGGFFVLEHRTRTPLLPHPQFFREAIYGDSTFSFFRKESL